VFVNKKFTARADGVTANDAMDVEGTMEIDGRLEDISAEYIFDIKFKRAATGRLISELLNKEDK